MKIGTQLVTAAVNPIKHKINVNTLEHLAAERLDLNDIGVCELELDRPRGRPNMPQVVLGHGPRYRVITPAPSDVRSTRSRRRLQAG